MGGGELGSGVMNLLQQMYCALLHVRYKARKMEKTVCECVEITIGCGVLLFLSIASELSNDSILSVQLQSFSLASLCANLEALCFSC